MGSVKIPGEAASPSSSLENNDILTASCPNSKECRSVQEELAKAKETIKKQGSRVNTLQLQITGQAMEIAKLKKQESEQRSQLSANDETKENLTEQLKKCRDILVQYESTMKLQREKVHDGDTKLATLHSVMFAKEEEISALKEKLECSKENLVESESILARRDGQIKWYAKSEMEWEEKVKRLEEELVTIKGTLREQEKSSEESVTWSSVLKETVFKQKTDIRQLKDKLEKQEQDKQTFDKKLSLLIECLENDDFTGMEKVAALRDGTVESKIKRAMVLTRDKILEVKDNSIEKLNMYRKKAQSGLALAYLSLMADEEKEISSISQVLPPSLTQEAAAKILALETHQMFQKNENVKEVVSSGVSYSVSHKIEALAKLEDLSSNEDEEVGSPLTDSTSTFQPSEKTDTVSSETQCKRYRMEVSPQNILQHHRLGCTEKIKSRVDFSQQELQSDKKRHPETVPVTATKDNKPSCFLGVAKRPPNKFKKVRFSLPDRGQRRSQRSHLKNTRVLSQVTRVVNPERKIQKINKKKSKQNVYTVHRAVSTTTCQCKRKFKHQSHLNHHVSYYKRLPRVAITCPICGKQFGSTFNLQRHQRIVGHHQSPPKLEREDDKVKYEPDETRELQQDNNVETGEEPRRTPVAVRPSPQRTIFPTVRPQNLYPVVLLERIAVVEVGEEDVVPNRPEETSTAKFPCWCCSLTFATQTERIVHHKNEHQDEI